MGMLHARIASGEYTDRHGGSFTTSKMDPNDIDFINFVKAEHIIAAGAENFTTMHAHDSGADSIEEYGVDAYLVPIYPEDHSYYKRLTEARASYFLDKFSKDKGGNKRGIVRVNLDYPLENDE